MAQSSAMTMASSWASKTIKAEDVSWLTTLFVGGKFTPDNPCVSMPVYACSSIGYGDITPGRYEEYLAGAVCQMIGGVVWARIIGSVCSILSCGDPVEEKFEASTDLLNNVMREARVPPRLCQVFREYLREAKQHNANSQFRVLAQHFSPQLRGYLLIHMSERWISNVAYFSEAPHAMIIDVAVDVDNHFFA